MLLTDYCQNKLQIERSSFLPNLVVGVATLLIYNLDSLVDKLRHKGKDNIKRRVIISLISCGCLIFLLSLTNVYLFLCVFLGTVITSVYAVPLGWKNSKNNFVIKEIPCFKSFFVAAAVTTACITVPMLASAHPPEYLWERVAPLFSFVFIITFLNSTIMDIADFSNDKKNNIQSLPVFLGVKELKILLLFMVFVSLFSIRLGSEIYFTLIVFLALLFYPSSNIKRHKLAFSLDSILTFPFLVVKSKIFFL